MADLYDRPEAMAPLAPAIDGALQEVAQQVCNAANRLAGKLHPLTAQAVATFLQPMNCYYSNLIEGHHTSPLDIERALKQDYREDRRNRNLQQEAYAHILTQQKLAERLAAVRESGTKINPYEPALWLWLHQEFYEHLPDDFREVKGSDGEMLRVVPGEMRTIPVVVGRHIAPAAQALPAFVAHFAWFYKPARTFNQVERIVHVAAAHHRFAWMHPFLDGNGRIGRLLSEAALAADGLAAEGLWSVSRGLARRKEEYKSQLANADRQRDNDLDGRGNLSEKALRTFCLFFLETALDQLYFMTKALDTDAMLDQLRTLARLLTTQRKLPPEAGYILQEAFLRGSIARRDLARVVGKSETTSRNLATRLVDMGLLSTGDRFSPYRVAYPVHFSPVLFPGLYPLGAEMEMMRVIENLPPS